MAKDRILLGKEGEGLVCNYLINQGYAIRETNFSSKYGEIDIIASKEEVLAFIEVKLRQQTYFYLSELIVPAKQRKIIKTALWYISTNRIQDVIYRFDVALVEFENNDYSINFIENAFTSQSNADF